MTTHNGYRFLGSITALPEASELISRVQDCSVSLAAYAQDWFVGPATRGDDGRRIPYSDDEWKSRIADDEWLYIAPRYLLRFLTQDSVEMGYFRSSPESDIDTWAQRKVGKISLSLHDLWVPVDSVDMLTNNDVSTPDSSTWSLTTAIADDIYNRMKIDYDGNINNVARQRVYNFLIQESNTELPSCYGLPKTSYRLIDKKAKRNYLEVGKGLDVGEISIQCKSNGIDVDSITFLNACHEFIHIRNMNKYK